MSTKTIPTAEKKRTSADSAATAAVTDVSRVAEQYNKVPYQSHPFPLTQPARIGALARLFGLEPPDVEKARVLEIGCASGGNIIPLAARFPDASFTGVDLSDVQITAGKERAKSAGLSNIELKNISVTDFDAPAASFDYVICHGVFSWVTESVRDAIFARVGKLLSPDGVAYISYNVLPGWRMRMAIRDAMTLHAGEDEDPALRISRARWMLNFLAQRTSSNTLWGHLFRNEAAFLSQFPEDYIFHEFLEDTNEPMMFSTFAQGARKHGLAYLGDAELASMIPENIDEATATSLREMCSGKALPLEQYMDIVTGRTFRQSLLIRESREAKISRQIEADRLRGLHILCSGTLRQTEATPQSVLFAEASGRHIRSGSAVVVEALNKMIARFPASVTIESLVEGQSDEARLQIEDALIKMLRVGLLGVSLSPVKATPVVSERPHAFALARRDAAMGPSVVNARHEACKVGLVAQTILPDLDGQKERSTLRDVILKAVSDGRIVFQQNGVTIASEEGVMREAGAHLDAALGELARGGLLAS